MPWPLLRCPPVLAAARLDQTAMPTYWNDPIWCETHGHEWGKRGRCQQCGKQGTALQMSGKLHPGRHKEPVRYDLENWPGEKVADLIEQLIAADIAHRFEGKTLIVGQYDRSKTDRIFRRLAGEPDEEDVEPGPQMGSQLSGRRIEESQNALFWNCKNCGKSNGKRRTTCWNCGPKRDFARAAALEAARPLRLEGVVLGASV